MSSSSRGLIDRLLERTSRTFALAIPLLPQPTAHEVAVAYLLLRAADTLEDATRWAPRKRIRELDRFCRFLQRASPESAAELSLRWREDPPVYQEGYLELLAELPSVTTAWLGLRSEVPDLIRAHVQRITEQMAFFVDRTCSGADLRLLDLEDLQGYCYGVAGIVGELLTELFLAGREGLAPVSAHLRTVAATFGEGLQLVNVLKDAAADATADRCYLPKRVDCLDVFALARLDLEAASGYVSTLQRSGAERGLVEFTALLVLLARATLDRVEAEGAGSKLSRSEVGCIAHRLCAALDRGEPPLSG